MSAESRPAAAPVVKEPRLIRRMRLCFAVLSCLGGLAMGLGGKMDGFPLIAAFFALFGYLFVDLLKLFALPPTLAYLGMAFAGLYCVGEFTNAGRQILAVAELLIIVQAIMMLQEKTQRVYEQIVIFCLLQLVVAAVFNDAILYGILLLPIGLVGAWGHSLLSAFAAARLGDDSQSVTKALIGVAEAEDEIFTSADEAQWSLTNASRRVFWVACSTIAPSVILVTAIFFYALPRTTDANRTNQGSMAMVGFDDKVRLNQVGSLLRNNEQTLRVSLRDAERRIPYLVSQPMYLRGKVLEQYNFTGTGDTAGIWSAAATQMLGRETEVPGTTEVINFNLGPNGDKVEALVAIESTSTPALFSVAPYYETTSRSEVRHEPLRWTLTRSSKQINKSARTYPRMEYRFGTRGFRNGLQSELIGVWNRSDELVQLAQRRQALETGLPLPESDETIAPLTRLGREDQIQAITARIVTLQDLFSGYVNTCSQFNARRIPEAAYLAERIWNRLPAERRDRYEFARAATNYLNSGVAGFTYTIDLNFERNEQLDPIEQFLSVDKSGHCQYYASALAMILRSRGIPSRLVVGYCTDEFNGVAGHYVARQLHAHVWVEALLNRDEITDAPLEVMASEPMDAVDQQCWLRLDPTPGGGGGGMAGESENGSVTQVLDLAQNIWKDYVVDMDSERQEQALLASATDAGMSDAYGDLIRRGQMLLLNLRAGRLGGGAFAGRELFSWPAAILSILAAAGLLITLRIRLPSWLSSRSQDESAGSVARPSLAFYADAVDSLSQIGVHRTATQTPIELKEQADEMASDGKRPPNETFAKLTDLFVRARYGNEVADQRTTENLLADLIDRIQTNYGSKSKSS